MKSKLYSPCQIGCLTLSNRIIIPALNTSFASAEGTCTPRAIEYFRARSLGGAGLIVVGAIGVDPERINTSGVLQLSHDRYVPMLKALTEAVHGGAAKIFAQLWHPGAYARPEEYNDVQDLSIGPSAVMSGFTRQTPRAMSLAEIRRMVDCFGKAAARAKAAGFDGVELIGSAGYMISQFLSPKTNLRTDRYGGGTPIERMTFLKEVIASVRAEAGEDYPLMVRLSGNEFVRGGNDSSASVAIAIELERMGVHAINVTGGWHETAVPQLTMDVPHGGFAYLAAAIQSAVSIPVAACNRLDIHTAEALVDRGDVALAAMGRAFIADAELGVKAQEGRYDEICPCIACNQGCMDNIFRGKPLCCLTNPMAGREYEIGAALTKTTSPKNILVLGAGAAGMEYAQIAAKRGHTVTIWEKAAKPGGRLSIAGRVKGREEFAVYAEYLERICKISGVNIVCNKEATAEDVLAGDYNLVVAATGAKPHPLSVSQSDDAPVVQAIDVLAGGTQTGKRVVVIGSDTIAVETAVSEAQKGTISPETLAFLTVNRAEAPEKLYELLTRGYKDVTLVKGRQKLGFDMGASTKWVLLSGLSRYGVKQSEGEIVGITKEGVLLKTRDGSQTLLPADTVIVSNGSDPVNDLYIQLDGRIPVIKLGDAARSDAAPAGRAFAAVWTAFSKAVDV